MKESNPATRMLISSAFAVLVLGASALVMAEGSAPAASSAKSEMKSEMKTDKDGGKENWLDERMEHMTKRLKLTDEQKVKVKPILMDQMTKMHELRAKYEGKPEGKAAMDKERKELWADADEKLALVLNADQVTELKKMRAEHMNHKKWSKEKEENEKKSGT
jgi:hypothetical protein